MTDLPETCPKCGFGGRTPDGDLGVWTMPVYIRIDVETALPEERLSYECKLCGYKIETPCLDAK